MTLTPQELTDAASLLTQAKALCQNVRDKLLGKDTDASARVADIVKRLEDEIIRLLKRASHT